MNNGANTIEIKNRNPVTNDVSPVLPPAATPEDDSTNVVVVDVPKTAPDVVAMASANNAGLILGSLPSLSKNPAFELTPIKVPNVSKRSTNKNAQITTIKLIMFLLDKSISKHCPNVFPRGEKSNEMILDGITE